MMRPADQEMVPIEKIVCHSQFPQGVGTPYHAGPHGSTGSSGLSQGAEGAGREQRTRAFNMVSKGRDRQGREIGLGLAGLIIFRVLGGPWAVLGCLVSGPGVIRTHREWLRV